MVTLRSPSEERGIHDMPLGIALVDTGSCLKGISFSILTEALHMRSPPNKNIPATTLPAIITGWSPVYRLFIPASFHGSSSLIK